MTDSLIGTKIRNFRVVDLIGKGGMGEVYVGFDEKLERKVALKGIRAEHRLDAESKARFLREARVLSQLAHPGICQIFELVETEEADVLVLELIRGKILTHALAEKPGLDHKRKLRIAAELAQVLVAAHQKGVVHRDLKPDNVMLTEEGQVKVLDFGLSRSIQEDETVDLRAAPSAPVPPVQDGPETVEAAPAPQALHGPLRTQVGTVLGTLGYMSPEQARGQSVTAASDIYSLGLILQEMFTKESPYSEGTGSSFAERLERAKKGETRSVKGLDSDLTILIERMKSFDHSVRPTAIDISDRLRWLQEKPGRRRSRFLTVAAIAVLASFGAAMTIQTVRLTRAKRAAERQIAQSLNNIAYVYKLRGQYKEAEQSYKRSLAIWETALGPDHPDVAQGLWNFGRLYFDQERYAEAEPLWDRSLSIREKALGSDHPDLALDLYNLGCLKARQGKRAEALAYLRRVVPNGRDASWVANIDKDRDLHSLHGDAEFQKIVANVKERAARNAKMAATASSAPPGK